MCVCVCRVHLVEVMAGNTDPNRREWSTLMSTRPFTHLATDPLHMGKCTPHTHMHMHTCRYTFKRADTRAWQFQQLQGVHSLLLSLVHSLCGCVPVFAHSVCTYVRTFHCVVLGEGVDASDTFVCMSLYVCVCKRVLCVDCDVVYILYLISCILSVPLCVLAINKGLLALKVEIVNKTWIAQVALFDFLQVSSSPWLRPFSLPTRMGGAEKIYDIAFEQSNTLASLQVGACQHNETHKFSVFPSCMYWCQLTSNLRLMV